MAEAQEDSGFRAARLIKSPASLLESNGSVTISSDPTGAMVTWEGRELGRTPLLKASLPGGSHVLALRLAGYRDRSVEVSVAPGAETEVQPVLLEKALGIIDITTEPAGIGFQVVSSNRISISGVTPTNLRDLALDDYRVTLYRVGWADFQETMTLASSDPVSVTHRFEGGKLKITADRPGTTVTLDGTVLGTPPIVLDVSSGQHFVVATANGGSETKEVQVELGQTRELNLVAPAPLTAEVRLWTPGEGMSAATPIPTPAPTPKEEEAALLPTPTTAKAGGAAQCGGGEAATETISGTNANTHTGTAAPTVSD